MSEFPKMICGRRGLPPAVLQQMEGDYKALGSLAKVAAKWGRTRQAIYSIFKAHGIARRARNFHEPVFWKGKKFTPGRGGYLRASVREGGELQLHRLVWIDSRGPISPGHQVYFIDGDKRNFALENLECGPIGEVTRITIARRKREGREDFNQWQKWNKRRGCLFDNWFHAVADTCDWQLMARAALEFFALPAPRMRSGEAAAALLRSVWAGYTPEQRQRRLRGIHRRWIGRREMKEAA